MSKHVRGGHRVASSNLNSLQIGAERAHLESTLHADGHRLELRACSTALQPADASVSFKVSLSDLLF